MIKLVKHLIYARGACELRILSFQLNALDVFLGGETS